MTEEQLRQMMFGFDSSGTPPNISAGFPGMGGLGESGASGEDPMMKILQQMLGGAGAGGPGATFSPEVNGMGGPHNQLQEEPDPRAYIWRVIHFVAALAMGIYIATATDFTGAKSARSKTQGEVGVKFFWAFVTVELALQSSRFLMEKGRLGGSGILATIAGFLPEPYKGWVVLVARYSRIWQTLVADAMVVIFVLGTVSWWTSVP
jgi:hypothetical protein